MSLREFLNRLNKDGELVKIKKSVSVEHEIANILAAYDGKTVMFENVNGYDMKVVGGICSTRDLFAKALGIKKEDLVKKLADATSNPVEPEIVDKGECQEVIIEKENIDLEKFPFLKYFPQDGGKYIPSAVCIIKDPELGRNACYHRLMLIGKNRFTGRIIENRGTDTALKKNKNLEIAICIGNSVPVLLAGSISPAPDVDELGIANAFEKTQLVKCKTIDVEVPKDCEIVLEGKFTGEMDDEGPFVDLTETSDYARKQPVIEIQCITHRKDALCQALLPGKLEHKMLMGMPREPTIFNAVNKVCKCKNVSITPGGCSWLHAVVQIEKKNKDDDGKKAIEAAFKGHNTLKRCIVVDNDIDLFNPSEVEWALATRFQADKDLVVLSNQPGSSIDPSGIHADGKKSRTAKLGMDATIPFGKDKKNFAKVHYKKVDVNAFDK